MKIEEFIAEQERMLDIEKNKIEQERHEDKTDIEVYLSYNISVSIHSFYHSDKYNFDDSLLDIKLSDYISIYIHVMQSTPAELLEDFEIILEDTDIICKDLDIKHSKLLKRWIDSDGDDRCMRSDGKIIDIDTFKSDKISETENEMLVWIVKQIKDWMTGKIDFPDVVKYVAEKRGIEIGDKKYTWIK